MKMHQKEIMKQKNNQMKLNCKKNEKKTLGSNL